jgi:hypothetical protein
LGFFFEGARTTKNGSRHAHRPEVSMCEPVSKQYFDVYCNYFERERAGVQAQFFIRQRGSPKDSHGLSWKKRRPRNTTDKTLQAGKRGVPFSIYSLFGVKYFTAETCRVVSESS